MGVILSHKINKKNGLMYTLHVQSPKKAGKCVDSVCHVKKND